MVQYLHLSGLFKQKLKVQKFCRTVTMIFDRFCKNNVDIEIC